MQKAKLHGYWRSSASWRVRIALNVKGIEYEYIPVNLLKGEQKSEEHLKLNPSGFVPALEIDGHILTESLPIIEYLDEAYPDKAKMLPEDKLQRFQARRLAEVVNSGIQPIQNLSVLNRIADIGGDKTEWAKVTITNGLKVLETLVSQSKGKFCVGDEITIADCCLVPQLYSADRFGVDMTQFPLLCEIRENLNNVPEVAAAHANVQVDAVL